MSEPTLIQWLTLASTVVALGLSTYSLWHQRITHEEKLRLDLFEKRLAVYKAFVQFSLAVQSGVNPVTAFQDSVDPHSHSIPFLFGRGTAVADLATELLQTIGRLGDLDNRLIEAETDDDAETVENEITALTFSLGGGLLIRLDSVFEPPLTILQKRSALAGVNHWLIRVEKQTNEWQKQMGGGDVI
jgi:hypothetical protein